MSFSEEVHHVHHHGETQRGRLLTTDEEFKPKKISIRLRYGKQAFHSTSLPG